MAIATLTVDLEARLAGLQSGFSRLEQLAQKAAKQVSSVGTGIKIGAGIDIFSVLRQKAEELVRKIPDTIKELDDLDERAQNLGVSARDLSSLDITAGFSGVDNIDKAFDKFNKTLADAKAGGVAARTVLGALGVDMKGLQAGTLTSLDAFRQAADTIKSYRDGLEKSALVQEAFGSKQTKLIAFLNQGGAALTQFAGASDEAVENAKKLQAELDKLSAKSQKWWLTISGKAAGLINDTIDAVAGATVNSADERLKRLDKSIVTLQQRLAQRQNPETLLALNSELQEAIRLSEDLRQKQIDRFAAGQRAARGVDSPAPAAPVLPTSEAQSFLKSLEKQVDLQEKGEFAALRVAAAELKIAAAAEPYIKKLEARKALLERIAAFNEDALRAERDRNEFLGKRDDLSNQLRQIEFETTLIGKSRDAIEELTAARAVDQQLAQALVGKEEGEVNRLIDLYDQYRAKIVEAVKARNARGNENAIALLGRDFGEQIKDIELATDLIGRTRDEVELLTASRDIDRRAIQDTASLEGKALDDRIAAWERFRGQILSVTEAQQQVRKNLEQLNAVAEGVGDAFSKSFEDAVIDGKSLSDAIADLAKDIQRVLIRELISKPISQAIADSIKKAFRDAAKEGDFDLVGWLKRLFSGGGSSSAGWLSGTGALDIQGFASGGYIKPGQMAWVGERGPELAWGGRHGATIYPSSGGGGTTVMATIHIDSRADQAQVRRNAELGVRAAVARIEDKRRRNG